MSHDNRYETILYWSKEDQAIIAEWIETAQQLGRVIPQPKGRLMFA
ncbi:MAG: hypothetical protein O7G88_23290 [bacterium]|nr:hypothetical protein [bacterium]